MFFEGLSRLDAIFWGYVAFFLILFSGVVLTFQSRFVQFTQIPLIFKTFWACLSHKKEPQKGVHPVKIFFASTGGMIGIGNVVGITTAVQFGGPGALFWIWVAGVIGAILKYSEIYLGLKFRVENAHGGYDGGPMFFLKQAFRSPAIPFVVAILLCLYGVEIYQFTIIADSVSSNWHFNRTFVVLLLLLAILWAALGGVSRIGKISLWIIPVFLQIYAVMGICIIVSEASALPAMLAKVIHSAFTGHAAVGGFAGSTMLLAIQHGIARTAYSADIGVGYDSIIQSESSISVPHTQAALAILGVLIDNFICTLTILVVLLSGAWLLEGEGTSIIQAAFSTYFPYMDLFLPFFYIVTGYTTLIVYFCVGLKCCRYLFPRHGKALYLFFGCWMFLFFSYTSQSKALLVMSVAGAMLLIINLIGIFRLRNEISFFDSSVELKN
ncbi:MAG: sodium:alanine symporter family protein [Verrucomicrobia bacterium]|nr:sodium:alanine symporter family protein [Verrucomicrobiota bacterium]MBS0646587.1 sodium:alanine symporter family protein [Verrucomicrobiota bacterium]